MMSADAVRVDRAQRDRVIWLDRYQVCVTTDPHHSKRRWLLIEWLAAAHVALEPEDLPPEHAHGLSDEALCWLEDVELAKLFQSK